jgi:hypothetical protein
MDTEEKAYKVQEVRLRNRAKRMGYILQKSRRRDPQALGYGTYMLVDASNNTIAAGDTNNGFGMNLDEIEAALNE